MFEEYLGLYSGPGIRLCSSHRAEDFAGRNPCPPDSRTGPVFRFQTFKMTRMSKPIRQKNSSVRTFSRLLLWLKTADRQRQTAQASATVGVEGAAIYGGSFFAWQQRREPPPLDPPLPPLLPAPHLPFLPREIRVLGCMIPR